MKTQKSIDLSNLILKSNNSIDWKYSIGKIINFNYNEVYGTIKIVKYIENRKLLILYKDQKHIISTDSLNKCKLGRILLKNTKEFKVEIGTIFSDEKRNMKITNRFYKKNKNGWKDKWYTYTCFNCGWSDGKITEGHLIGDKNGCGCCAREVIVPEINSVYKTDLWMVKYFVNPEDAKKYTSQSHVKLYFKCPDCGRIKNNKISIFNLYYTASVSCPCGDHMSYPNKFMYFLLEQVNINFIKEYAPKWAMIEFNNKKRGNSYMIFILSKTIKNILSKWMVDFIK